ncbi:hypothetical protein [Bacillus sp. SA1-12]|nr:hypothetical protein [Bacillus sp. SA1-12]
MIITNLAGCKRSVPQSGLIFGDLENLSAELSGYRRNQRDIGEIENISAQ